MLPKARQISTLKQDRELYISIYVARSCILSNHLSEVLAYSFVPFVPIILPQQTPAQPPAGFPQMKLAHTGTAPGRFS